VAPGLYIGRLPFPFELDRVRAAGVGAVLNLCWEFPRFSGTDREPGIETAHVPILDGSPPSDRQFREAVEWAVRWRAEGLCVLVHCAQGHGRTATVAAAILLRLGLAPDVEQALSMVRAVRPRARPSLQQRAALIRYASDSLSPQC
jgi:protein-tyrosine phosphatase